MIQENFYAGQPVLVRDSDQEQWHYSLYSHKKETGRYVHVCIDSNYKQCIPFIGNEELVGTYGTPSAHPYACLIGHHVVFSMNGNVYIAHLSKYDKENGTLLFQKLFNTTRRMFSAHFSRMIKTEDIESLRAASQIETALYEEVHS